MVHELCNHPPHSLPKFIKFWHFTALLYHSHLLLLSIFQHVDVEKHTLRMTAKPFETCVSICRAFFLPRNSQRQSSGSHSVALADLEHPDPRASASWVCIESVCHHPGVLYSKVCSRSVTRVRKLTLEHSYGTWWYLRRFQNCPGSLVPCPVRSRIQSSGGSYVRPSLSLQSL